MMKTDKKRPELNGHPRRWLKIWLAVLTLAVALGFGLIFHLYSHRGPAASLAPSPAPPAGLDAAQAPAGQAPPGLPAFTDADQNPLSPREAFERLLASAEAGSAPAMLNLAEFYGNGWGVRQNLTERYQWLEKAAEAGDPQGAFRAGLALEMGLGVAADQAAAASAFERAAALGLPEAHFKLAEGLLAGPEGDPARAAGHLDEALAGGFPMAANMLALLYMQGAGNLEADAEKARQALLRGAELADPEALKNLAVMFKEGLGGPADPAEALKWYLAARQAGWQGGDLEATLAELEAQVGGPAARQAEALAREWLAERQR